MVAYVDRSADLTDARRRALERCLFVSNTSCTVYAEDDVVTFDESQWADHGILPTSGAPFDPDRVPFVRGEVRQRPADYARAPDHKALAVAPDGAWRWIGGRSSRQEATATALAGCRQNTRAKCMIYATGDIVTWD